MIIYKFFSLGEYEKQEKWINNMCSKGYALKDFKSFIYSFEKCIPNEYYYSLELLENLPSSPNHEDFLNYLEDEWCVKYVCHYKSWAFFRRKRTLGKFSLFSDLQSKIHYFKKILTFRFCITIGLISFAVLNILYSPKGSIDNDFAVLLILISIIILVINTPTFVKYHKLKKSAES